jgi:hypothetical protein
MPGILKQDQFNATNGMQQFIIDSKKNCNNQNRSNTGDRGAGGA